MPRTLPEQALQRTVADFLSVALPPDAYWSAIGHGGGGRIRGAVLKGMGVKAGVPDLFIICRGRAIFIELKTAKGRVSPAQLAAHDRITVAGGVVETCRSVEAVEEFLWLLSIPLRASCRGRAA